VAERPDPGDRLQDAALAGARRALDDEALAGVDPRVHAVDDHTPARELEVHVVKSDRRIGHSLAMPFPPPMPEVERQKVVDQLLAEPLPAN